MPINRLAHSLVRHTKMKRRMSEERKKGREGRKKVSEWRGKRAERNSPREKIQ